MSAESAPHVIYYYGHGAGDADNSRLLFADANTGRTFEKPIADVANFLRNLPNGPRLVYLNCCHGDTGGLLGAGRQLGSIVPAVVTNSTAADVDAAQQQGLSFLRNVLLKGKPPHIAIGEIRSNLSSLDLTLKDIRWMTPVLHCHYDSWKTSAPSPRNRMIRHSDWHLKVDRSAQFSIVHSNAIRMMKERSPSASAYVWYGEEKQGVSMFNQRLQVELRELASSSSTFFHHIKLDWPMQFEHPASDFEYMFTAALSDRNIESIDDIPQCIASRFPRNEGQETPILLYISNEQPHTPSVIQPQDLKRFLSWWENRFVAALENTCFTAVLGLSFILGNSEKDRVLLNGPEMSEWYFTKMLFQVLEELNNLALRDLAECLLVNGIQLPPNRMTPTLIQILSQTMGRYEPAVDMLKDVEQIAWSLDLDE